MVGLVLVVLGVAFHLWGRVKLKPNPANQIKVFEGRKRLMTAGK